MADVLTKIALASAILGLVLLVIIADRVNIPTSEIGSIKKEDQNQEVKLRGWVKSPTNKDSLSIFNLQDRTGTIKVVAFKPQNLTLTKNSFIEVHGKISLYEENLQVIADNIILVNNNQN